MKRLFVILAVVVTTSASARIISYAPYTDRTALPVQQNRLNRYFVLLESANPSPVGFPGMPIMPPPGGCCYQTGQLVLYDTKGEFEPRVIFPTDGVSVAGFSVVAVRETRGTPVILIQTTNNMSAAPTTTLIWMLSTDGGNSWKTVSLPQANISQVQYTAPDIGGPNVHDRYSPVRIGTDAYPFVVSLTYTAGVYAISATGAPKLIVAPPNPADTLSLIGSDSSGSLFLVRIGNMLYIYELNGIRREIGPLTPNSTAEGWITPTGAYVYVDERTSEDATLWFYGGGMRGAVISGPARSDFLFGLIDIPAFDYSGAWIITRGASLPTALYRHTPTTGLQKQWEDVTAPQVEALHAGRSGNSLLVQVNRPRPQPDQRMFVDPALAIWHTGQPAPRAYDELFMNEQPSKGFVHLDVDAVEGGELFVFDSGPQYYGPSLIISPAPPAGGGSDVVQEWGVVRASLAQRLVLPSVGRTPGAFGSYWMTDVIIYNPLTTSQDVKLRFVAGGNAPEIQALHEKTLTLAPREIRRLPDVLSTVFQMTTGNGALFITPASAVNVTSRTYTTSEKGTYGFGMNGIDVFTAASARFPLTYSAAFQGKDFRTNLILADVSGRGSDTHASAVSIDGSISNGNNVVFSAPANGQQQFNLLSETLTSSTNATGALVLQPQRGELIGSVMVIDNLTNDPTFFPPDLPASTVRTIPAIGHLDGANGSKFRTDLFLYNPSNTPRPVTIQIKAWDTPEVSTVQLTLLGNESRVIRDALFRSFGRTGIARLRFVSTIDNTGVRMTARTYNIDDNGGTFGYLMPALNNFQAAGPGDTLEILGVVGGERFRTNIGLVELTGFANGQNASARVEIIDDKGATIDTLTVNMPVAGGMQLNDIFHARGLGDGPPAALIRVTALAGTFAAYATTLDNGTNDPVYLAANLAAQE